MGPSSWFLSAYFVFVRFCVLSAVRGNVTVSAMSTEWYNESIIRRKAGTSENNVKEGSGVGSNWAIGGDQTDRLLTDA
jgi:hypothetical protein